VPKHFALQNVCDVVNKYMKGLLHVFQYSLTPDALCPSRLSRAPNSDKYDRSVTVIIIIIFIYCIWVVTQWQWLCYMYTKHEIGYY